MIDVQGPFSSGAAAGGAGVATANADSNVKSKGLLQAIYVDYQDSPPATTDVIITTKGTDPNAPAQTLLTLTNLAADGWFYPRTEIHDSDGNQQTGVFDYFPILDNINVKIQGANDNDSVRVWITTWNP